ncbi:UNVERIFIED_CONTAM: hypothetical protein FKN15_050187 [Acipenser sinensis]
MGRPRRSYSKAERARRLKWRGLHFPFVERMYGWKHLPLRMVLTYEQAALAGFINCIKNIKVKRKLQEMLNIETDRIVCSRDRCEMKRPVSPIQEPDKRDDNESDIEDRDDIKIVDNCCFIQKMKPQKKNRRAVRKVITKQNKIKQNKHSKTKKSTHRLSSTATRTLVDVAPIATDLPEETALESGTGDGEAGIDLVDDPELNEMVCSDGALEGSLHPTDIEMTMNVEESKIWKTRSQKKKQARNISQDGPDVDVGVGNLIGPPSSLNHSTVPEDMGDATMKYQTQKAARTPSEKKRMIMVQNDTDTNSLSLTNKIKKTKHDKKKNRKDSLTSTAEGTPVSGSVVFTGFQAPVENALENSTGDGEAGIELSGDPVTRADLETNEPICSDLQPADSELKNLKIMNVDASETSNTKDRLRIKKKMEKRARKSSQDSTYEDVVGNLVERSSSPNLATVPEGMGGASATMEYETNEGPQLNKEPCSDIILEGSHVVDDQVENPNSMSAGASHICKTKNGQKQTKKNWGRNISQVGTSVGVGSLVDPSSSSPSLSTEPENSSDVCAVLEHQIEAAETFSEKKDKKTRKKKGKRDMEEMEGTNSTTSLNLSTEEIHDGITDNSEIGNLHENRPTHCESGADQTGGGLERDDSNIEMGGGKGNSTDHNLPPVKRKKNVEQQSVPDGLESQETDLEAQDAPRECENLNRSIVTTDESTLLKHLEPGEFTHTKKKSHKKKSKKQRVGYDIEMQGPHLSPPNTCDLLVDGGNEYTASKKDIKDTDIAELRELRTKKKKSKRKCANEEMEAQGILSPVVAPTCELYVDGRWETIDKKKDILAESDTAELGASRIMEKKQCVTDGMEAQGMRSSLTACKSSLDAGISQDGILLNGGGQEKPTKKKKGKKKNQNDRQEKQGLRPTSVGESLAGEVTTGEIQKHFGTSGGNESVRPEALVDLFSESNSAGDLLQGVKQKQDKKEKKGKKGKQETTSSVLAWQLSEQTSGRKGEIMSSSGKKTKCQINFYEAVEDNGKPAKNTLLSMTSIEKGKGKSANADSRKCKRKLFNSALYEMFDSTKTD